MRAGGRNAGIFHLGKGPSCSRIPWTSEIPQQSWAPALGCAPLRGGPGCGKPIGIVHQFVTKNQVVCPARTPWVAPPGAGYRQPAAYRPPRPAGQGGRGGPETSQTFPSQDRRPAAKAGLIAARLCLCRPASVPRILRWRMLRISPPFPIKVLPEHFHALIVDSRSSMAASWFARLRPERHEQACTSPKR